MYETGHLKVAITTDNLFQVDTDFISAKQVVFYDVSSDSSEFIDVIQFGRNGAANDTDDDDGEPITEVDHVAIPEPDLEPTVKGHGKNGGACCGGGPDDGKSVDRLTAMVEALAGSSVLFTMGLSDVQAVKMHNIGVFPVKMEKSRDISEVIDRLQLMLNGTPPLWMVRALKNTGHKRELFANQEA